MNHARTLAEPPKDSPSSPAITPDAERSYTGVVFAIFIAYLLLATGLYYFRGFRFISPDRWAPFLFLAALALGRGRVFVRDWIPFVALLFGYEYMRGVASQVADLGTLTAADHGQVKIDFLLDAELWLFRGTIPSIWLQERLYTEGDTHWYDVAAGLVYLLHFVFPLVFAFVLWLRNKEHYWRFTIALVAMSYVAFTFFLLLPAAPPWMAEDWGYIQGLERPTGQAFRAVLPHRADNFDTFQIWTKASPNPVAPFPSLHAAFPWLVMLFARKFFGRMGWIFVVYNVAVWFSIVYLGLHWFVDILAGIALAMVIFSAMERLWPHLAAYQGIPWPAPVAAKAASTRTLITSSAATVRRRATSYALSRELPGILAVVAIAATAFVFLLRRGAILGIDSAVQFYPLYSFLGDQLRSGSLPVWNPHSYGGMPFIADPQSGWMYLPAMFAFAVFPLTQAIQVFVVFHLLLVGLSTYTLGRLLGLSMLPAVVAAAALQMSGWFSVRSACCTVELEVVAWLPLALVGVELAVRSRSWIGRAAAWSVAGLAMAQMLAAWLGQGGYYAGLTVGGYIVYRTLIDPPARMTIRRRVIAAAGHGGVIGILSIALVAAALLPRLESSLADGYPWEGVHGGWPTLLRMAERLLGRTAYYAGAATLALAGVGILLGRRRFATPFFALLALVAAILSMQERTPVHRLLFLVLPRFEDMNRNLPERSLIVFYLPIAMLAGIAVESLSVQRIRGVRALVPFVPIGLLAALALYLDDRASRVGQWTLIPILAIGAILLGALTLRLPALRRAAPLLLASVLLVDLLTAGHVLIQERTATVGLDQVDLDTYYDRPPAATYLQSISGSEPFRFFGYDATLRGGSSNTLYRREFGDARTARLLVNNRGVIYGLDDLQGANNPIHVARYDDLITAANSVSQDYHDADIYPSGLYSPILDLLNVRYIVLPAAVPPGRPDLLHLNQRLPTAYIDTDVRVMENAEALPRAWIVHDTRQVGADEALALLATGQVDPRRTALFEETPPTVTQPSDGERSIATVSLTAPDRLEVSATAASAGVLVLSEITYPGWRAYVDGRPAPLYTVDHALRSVALPAGVHTIELRYESRILDIGLVISLMAYLVLAAITVPGVRHLLTRTAVRSVLGR